MKKLALALMCLVSVAFFASCTKTVEHPEPSIAIMTGENFVYDGQTVDLGTTYSIGFRAASNAETQKELAKFNLKASLYEMDGTLIVSNDTTIVVSGTEYVFQNNDLTFNYTSTREELVGKAIFTATITDVDGKINSATINLNINQPEEPLAVGDFDWYRLGNTQTGLEEYGLYWERNAKSPFAQIKPVQGVVLYKFDSSVWNEVVYESQKAAKFADGATTAAMYNNVDVNANALYDDVIGTRMPDGTLHLLHVTSCVIGAQQTAGRPIHIYGQAK